MAQLPSPPFHDIPGVHNFRDIGGYAISTSTSPTRSLRRNYIYRCADPSRITSTGKQKLSQELGITTIFDLRSNPEIAKAEAKGTSVAEIQDVQRHHTPAFAEQDYSPEKIALRYKDYAAGGPEGFTKAYRDILENAGPSYRKILMHLRDRPNDPLALHCTAGKDRTGVLVALVMKIAGVEDGVVAREYALTDLGLLSMRGTIMEHLMNEPALNGDREAALRMIVARDENMLGTLEMIRNVYGSPEGYVKSHCGLSDEDIERIRKNVTADVAPVL